ncbi:MAG: hypothetical protein HKN07_09975 [Acidimicrobiia bacterium]|nr:hypothetical protein [Acidimicrobiia bacterium]
MGEGAIRVLELAGSPAAIGKAHGSAYAHDIRRYAEERIGLVAGGSWSGGPLSRDRVLEIASSCLPHHLAFSPELTEEMVAIGASAGLSAAEMIIVGGFTDFVDTVRGVVGGPTPPEVLEDDCTAFIVPSSRAADGQGLYGQTWDMHDTATEFVVLTDVRPDDRPRAMVFTTTGCVGQIGMNEAGVTVGINNLTGVDGRPGVTWPLVVRRALEQETAADAMNVIRNAPVAGAHSYLVLDAQGNGGIVEKTPTTSAVAPLGGDPLVHTNHMLDPSTQGVEAERPAELVASSTARHQRAEELLEGSGVTEEGLMALTRDDDAICQISSAPFHIESCGAAIMRPATLDFWAVWGLPKDNVYEHFSLAESSR